MNCAKCNKHSEDQVACDFCREAVYCSKKCQAMHWEQHDCANALHVDQIAATNIFVPYHYEDTLSLEAQEALDVRDPVRQTYSMQEVLPDMTVRSRIQSALIEAPVETIELEHMMRGSGYVNAGTYSIEINSQLSVGGAMPRDMIFAENKLNPKAKTLGGGQLQAETSKWAKQGSSGTKQTFVDTRDSLIFWPGADRVYAEKMEIPSDGVLNIKLRINDELTKELTGHYDFLHETQEPSRVVQKNLLTQLETRIAGIVDSSSNLRTIQCTDQQGNRAVITALIDPEELESARVVDLEFVAPAATLKTPQETEHAFAERRLECDPENLNELVGLAMGLELHTASGRAENPRLHELSSTISRYARQKMDDPENTDLTPEIASAVTEAVEVMHDELIGAQKRLSVNPFKKFSGYFSRARSNAQVKRDAKKIKLSDTTDADKKEQLQAFYDDRLKKAEERLDNGKSAKDYLEQADIIYRIAGERIPERKKTLFRKGNPASEELILNRKDSTLKILVAKNMAIEDQELRTKDAASEYQKHLTEQRSEKKKSFREKLKKQRRGKTVEENY